MENIVKIEEIIFFCTEMNKFQRISLTTKHKQTQPMFYFALRPDKHQKLNINILLIINPKNTFSL